MKYISIFNKGHLQKMLADKEIIIRSKYKIVIISVSCEQHRCINTEHAHLVKQDNISEIFTNDF